MADQVSCACSELGDFAVVRMGDAECLDERVFATIESVIDHGGDRWWLHAARCSVCGQNWMIAQESRIHDNNYLKQITTAQMASISERGEWPSDFLQLENIIKLGPDNKQVCHFLNLDDLTCTVKELIEVRSDISAADISYLFCISAKEARRLMGKATSTSWANLRPFA